MVFAFGWKQPQTVQLFALASHFCFGWSSVKHKTFCTLFFHSFVQWQCDISVALERVEFSEKIFNSPPGSVDCTEGVPRVATPGANIFEHSVKIMNPQQPVGRRVWRFDRETSTDCTRYDYKGVLIINTRSANKNMETTESVSLSALTTGSSTSVEASVGLKMLRASAAYSEESSFEKKAMETRKYSLTEVKQVDNVMALLSSESAQPEFSEELRYQLYQCRHASTDISNSTSNDTRVKQHNHDCVMSLLRHWPWVAVEATFGSVFKLVSENKIFHTHWSKVGVITNNFSM